MAFLKTANAAIVQPGITFRGWDEIHPPTENPFGKRVASKVVLEKFDPKQYLLSHATIVASVDTENSPDPLGKHMVDGFQINRKFADYLITPNTAKFVNNNVDAWERKLLLACYKTFTGSHNYLEHVQIPEMSKGRIIDAAARDIGESVYVDILVATDRKHKALIDAIQNGKLGTLSMGCTVAYCQCSKCGNVAHDETEMCTHIKYFKGNDYIDSSGTKRKIAELCGHHTDPDSVKFIEASWVANPAFKGAVLRNVLTPAEAATYGKKVMVAFNTEPTAPDPTAMLKAARTAQQAPTQVAPEAPTQEPAKEEAPADPMSEAVDSLAEDIKNKAVNKVRQEMKGPAPTSIDENRNETLIHAAAFDRKVLASAMKSPEWRKIATIVLKETRGDLDAARRILLAMVLLKAEDPRGFKQSSLQGQDILAASRLFDKASGKPVLAGEQRVYRTVIQTGGPAAYPNENLYLKACQGVFGRALTDSEKTALLKKGRLFRLAHKPLM